MLILCSSEGVNSSTHSGILGIIKYLFDKLNCCEYLVVLFDKIYNQLQENEIDKIEKKYENKTSTEDQNKKAQEMMMIYQKYKINPMSGCLLSFIQLPLLFAFLEAINRTPALFENDFLVFQMGTTPWVGISSGNYWYILLIVLIIGTTFISFRKTLKDQSGPTANSMKYTIYFMLAMISVASLTLPAALGIYWITSSAFTILQNIYVEKKKVK